MRSISKTWLNKRPSIHNILFDNVIQLNKQYTLFQKTYVQFQQAMNPTTAWYPIIVAFRPELES